jgi:hypothetical protein
LNTLTRINRTWPAEEPERRTALTAAAATYDLIRRDWFAFLSPKPDPTMCKLLMYVLRCELKNRPTSKKAALAEIGIKNRKNVRKYVNRAVEFGFIELAEGPNKRHHYLLPSKKLRDAALLEFLSLARVMKKQPFLSYEPAADTDSDGADRQDWGLGNRVTRDYKIKPPGAPAALRVPA